MMLNMCISTTIARIYIAHVLLASVAAVLTCSICGVQIYPLFVCAHPHVLLFTKVVVISSLYLNKGC